MTINKSRILSSVLVLALAASFAGCGANSDKQSAASNEQTKANAVSSPEEGENPLRIIGPGTDQGRYYVVTVPQNYSSLLCYLDFASGNEVPLCASPNCEHQDNSCPAWLHERNYTILNALDNEHLILMNSDIYTEETTLSIANADGSDPHILAEYPATYAISPVYDSAFLADEQYVYYFADTVPQIDDKTITEPLDKELFRVPLKGGTPEKMRNIKRDDTALIGTWGRDLILSRHELTQCMDSYKDATAFLRCSLDTGEETPLISDPVDGSTIGSYFSEGNLYWITNEQTDTLFWVDINGNQNQMTLDWEGEAPVFEQDSYCRFKFTALIQNHLILDVDAEQHCAYAIDLENGQVTPIALTYLNMLSGQEEPVNILQVIGSDLLVEFASVREQVTHYHTDNTAFLVDNTITRTGLISIDDYLSGRNNYREFNMLSFS